MKISVYYLLFGFIWIYFSDSIVELLSAENPHKLTLLQNYKGWFFIVLTASFLFILIYRLLHKEFIQYTRRINEQTASHEKLAQQDILLSTIVNSSPDAIFAKDMEGRYILFNTGAGELVNIAPEKVIGKTDELIFSPEAAEKIREMDRLTLLGGAIHNHEEDLITSGGIQKSFWVTKGPLLAENGKIFGVFGISRDITEFKASQTRLEQKNALLNSLIDSSSDAIAIKGLDRRYIILNKTAARLSGLSVDEVIGKTADDIFPPETAQMINNLDNELIKTKSFIEHEETMLMPNGTTQVNWVTKGLLTTENGEPFGIFGIYRDITAAKKYEQAIIDAKEHFDYMAHHDPLTDLPNRTSLIEKLQLKTSGTEDHPFALLFLDLDGFKEVNDSYGHRFGDELLIRITHLLQELFPSDAFISRTGGDEFVILLSCHQDRNIIHKTMLNLIDILNNPLHIEGIDLYITASIGIAMYPTDGCCAEELLQKADAAMYNAKNMGRNTYSFYDIVFTENALYRTTLATQLKKALQSNELELHFQPQIDVHTENIIGIEALLRWNTREETISPAVFIPIAEESGLILQLGEYVLIQGCLMASQWAKEGLSFGRVAINVSARQLTHIDFLATLDRIIQETECNPSLIELEITETSILENPEKMIALLEVIKAKGFHISIDDFGTGYSSLSYLKNLPIDKLKIDISFIRNITTEAKNQTIVKTIIALAKGLKMKVLAEGVETDEEFTFLHENDIDSIQGYDYYKPMPSADIKPLLLHNKYL
ncbi:putative bifunctional diguanylate cyclase/phosphodiesterase [Sulfuricurvum sp.]|uniref:putative bifunctional diguanylate cyclase/phosphodiesterase n=1 Tax=Sulfuricurvum sp. TaxID=2025608 RepID=UPI002D79BCB8|nr:EAL domain-containing protein [Sulfuricurvum sp.]